MLLYLALASTYGLAAAAMPGPLAAFLISHSLAHGWRRTAPAAFSPLLSDGPIALVVLLILSRVPPAMVHMLRLAGGLFLLYLAFEAFRSWRHFDPAASLETGSTRGSLLKAALVNLLNPNPYIGWSLVLGPLFLQGWAASPGAGLAVLLGFYGSMVVTLLGVIALFTAAGSIGPRLNRALLGLSGVGLLCFAAYQLWLWGLGP